MSSSATLPSIPIQETSRRRRLTETERNWLLSLMLVLGSILVFALAYEFEMSLGRWKDSIRLVRDPSESAMRFLALSHFFVAALYMSTSRRMRAVKPWLWVGASLGVGLLFCLGWSRLMAINPLFGTTLFFSYFLIHDYRDQVFFYFTNGDSKDTNRVLARLLAAAPLVVIGGGVALVTAAAAFNLRGFERITPVFGSISTAARTTLGVALVVITVASLLVYAVLLRKRRGTMSMREFLASHRPIFYVFAGSVVVLAASALIGASGDVIILLHVCAWYVFTVRQLQKYKPAVAPAAFSWKWMRTSLAGFNFVHIGSFVVFVIIGAIWSFGFRNDPSLAAFSTIVGREIFPYWTILHVSVSFPGR